MNNNEFICRSMVAFFSSPEMLYSHTLEGLYIRKELVKATLILAEVVLNVMKNDMKRKQCEIKMLDRYDPP